MKASVTSTKKVVQIDGVPARIWEGKTRSGIKIHCYITRVAISADEERTAEFEAELEQQKEPSAEIKAIPLRMIL